VDTFPAATDELAYSPSCSNSLHQPQHGFWTPVFCFLELAGMFSSFLCCAIGKDVKDRLSPHTGTCKNSEEERWTFPATTSQLASYFPSCRKAFLIPGTDDRLDITTSFSACPFPGTSGDSLFIQELEMNL